ncbi:hypothetical protein P175DRAFT_0530677 [Aspergillus ochraceoroseus IBT 24754]|uniref:Uncharacterized protein n=1 Tax=Aspergillus ochraceoroseus IBT 24754 TaxID=1392256 RepID=A0A2T5M4U0_9EURO|nr:uncharacterized protein P175DRAFT_0530677 [Aspergillus ochraceoroseus IBT 24754]PTU23550.1 hypothetical protein P175DRAFT_0530677 [Aspergillus ochraceoroseus IBT 24754]
MDPEYTDTWSICPLLCGSKLSILMEYVWKGINSFNAVLLFHIPGGTKQFLSGSVPGSEKLLLSCSPRNGTKPLIGFSSKFHRRMTFHRLGFAFPTHGAPPASNAPGLQRRTPKSTSPKLGKQLKNPVSSSNRDKPESPRADGNTGANLTNRTDPWHLAHP